MTKNQILTISTHTMRVGKLFILCACSILSFSCRHENDPSDTNRVTFSVDILSIDRDSTFSEVPSHLLAPSASPSDISLEQANMTDLWLFEGTTLLAHQHTGDANFGSPQVELSYGSHSITFVASSQSGQTFTSGTWHADKANDCFGSVETVDVSSSTSAQAVILMRCTYGLKWQSTDIVPSGVSKLRLKVSPMRESMQAGLHAVDGYERVYEYNVSSYVGRVVSVTVYGLPAEYGVEENITTTIEFLSSTDAVLYSRTKSVPVLTNRRTIITGALFNGSASSSIRVNSDWLSDYETSL